MSQEEVIVGPGLKVAAIQRSGEVNLVSSPWWDHPGIPYII